MERYKYQCWEGGPHIILPNSVANRWNGHVMTKIPLDPSTDYGRACRIERAYGFIEVGDGKGLVMRDPPLVAWDPSSSSDHSQTFFILNEWTNEALDDLLDRAKQEVEFKASPEIWEIPTGGLRMIYAGDDFQGSVAGRIDIPASAGKYSLVAGEYKEKEGNVIVLKLLKAKSPYERSDGA